MSEKTNSRLGLYIFLSIVAAVVVALFLPLIFPSSEMPDGEAVTNGEGAAVSTEAQAGEEQAQDGEVQDGEAVTNGEGATGPTEGQDGDMQDEKVVIHPTLKGILSVLEMGGEIFLNLLMMIVIPLVVTSVMCGIFGMGDIRKLGRPGGFAVLYYLSTTVLAVLVGLILVNLIQPGGGFQIKEGIEENDKKPAEIRKTLVKELSEGSDLSEEDISEVLPEVEEKPDHWTDILKNLVLMLFTKNLFSSAADGDLLPLIAFSIVFAGMLTTLGQGVGQLKALIQQVNTALLNFVLVLMRVAPFGIFCLVAARFGEAQAKGEFYKELVEIAQYFFTVVAGLGIHALATLPLIYWLITRKNPFVYIAHMVQAILTAFSTASSSATLPVTMECAQKNAKVSKRSTEFVLPLGATINMDGTALYEAVACLFIAQAVGQDLGFASQLIVAATATLAAIGAAGIPEAGLVTMVIVLNAVGLDVKYIAIILSIDWLLDRFRTAVNVLGDSIGAAVVDRTISDADK